MVWFLVYCTRESVLNRMPEKSIVDSRWSQSSRCGSAIVAGSVRTARLRMRSRSRDRRRSARGGDRVCQVDGRPQCRRFHGADGRRYGFLRRQGVMRGKAAVVADWKRFFDGPARRFVGTAEWKCSLQASRFTSARSTTGSGRSFVWQVERRVVEDLSSASVTIVDSRSTVVTTSRTDDATVD